MRSWAGRVWQGERGGPVRARYERVGQKRSPLVPRFIYGIGPACGAILLKWRGSGVFGS